MFEVKIKALVIDENGKEKYSKFSHLVNSDHWFDAGTKVEEGMQGYDHEITHIDQSNIESVLLREGQEEQSGLFRKVKVVITDVDQHSGKEKKTNHYWLVEAESTKEADERMRAEIARWLVPAEIANITETKICEYLNS